MLVEANFTPLEPTNETSKLIGPSVLTQKTSLYFFPFSMFCLQKLENIRNDIFIFHILNNKVGEINSHLI